MSVFLGKHIVVDMVGCKEITSQEEMGEIATLAVEAAGATIVGKYVTQNSVVLVLAESHLSIHRYHGFLALDVFTCGDSANPQAAVDFLIKALSPKKHEIKMFNRGEIKTKKEVICY